jgi:hypothetical protein
VGEQTLDLIRNIGESLPGRNNIVSPEAGANRLAMEPMRQIERFEVS